MKKQITSILFLCIGIIAVFAQEPVVKRGKPITHNFAPSVRIKQVFMPAESGFYALRNAESTNALNSGFILEKYDDKYAMISSTDIRSTEGTLGNSIHFRTLIPLKEKTAVFYTGYKKASKESFCLVRYILPDGSMDKTDLVIETLKADKVMNSGSFDLTASPDLSKILLTTTFPSVKGEKAKIRVKVFDTKSMKELWSKEAELDFDARKGSIAESLVDNEGNAYLLGKYVKERGKDAYNIYTYSMANSQWQTIEIDPDKKWWFGKQNHLGFNANGDVVFVAFLNETVATHYLAIQYVRINGLNQSLEANKSIGLEGKDNNGNFYGMKLNWIIKGVESQSNGTTIIIAEDENMTRTTASSTAGDYNYKFQNKDIRVFAILPDGDMAWVTKLYKNQNITIKNTDHRWDSFVYTIANDKIYIVYNNTEVFDTWNRNVRNFVPTYLGREFAFKTYYPVFLYAIEPNGALVHNMKYGLPLYEFQKDMVYSTNINSSLFLPLPNGILMMEEKPDIKKYQFGKIYF